MSYCVSYSSDTIAGHPALLRQHTADLNDESAHTRKLNGSSAETPNYQNLHRELLLSHKRYFGLNVHTVAGVPFLGRGIRAATCGCVTWLRVTVQRPAAGGETRAEASAGAAQTGVAQGGGDGTAASVRPGDGAPQEAAEAEGGRKTPVTARHFTCELYLLFMTNTQTREEWLRKFFLHSSRPVKFGTAGLTW